MAVSNVLDKIHEQIRKAAEAIGTTEDTELIYINLAGELVRKLKAEYRNDP